jgi:hypothetical protein
MLNPDKDPPTHTGWSQRRERGKFREWYKRGHLWMEKNPQGQTIICTYEGIPGPRGYDGFIWWYPNGVEPPPPLPPKEQTQARRPGAHQADASDDEGF